MLKYYRFLSGFRKFNKIRMQPDEAIVLARSFIKERMAGREDNFLKLVEKGIFQYSRSPYLKLLQPKKISFPDIKSWVSKDGIEASLRTLEREGIYFSVDEFKGRVPVKRNGMEFRCDAGMFDNPFMSDVYEVRSGATRSAGTRIRIDFDYLHQRSLYDALLLDIHGCLTAPVANWFPVFPGAPGINSSLRFAHLGNPVRRWFSQVDEDKLSLGLERKWGKRLLYLLSRMYGCPLAEAEYVGLNDARRVAENKRLMTATACVEVMPTGLSSTTQPWTSRLFFLAARAPGSLLVRASESGAICTSDAAAMSGDFSSASFFPPRSRCTSGVRKSFSIRSAS